MNTAQKEARALRDKREKLFMEMLERGDFDHLDRSKEKPERVFIEMLESGEISLPRE